MYLDITCIFTRKDVLGKISVVNCSRYFWNQKCIIYTSDERNAQGPHHCNRTNSSKVTRMSRSTASPPVIWLHFQLPSWIRFLAKSWPLPIPEAPHSVYSESMSDDRIRYIPQEELCMLMLSAKWLTYLLKANQKQKRSRPILQEWTNFGFVTIKLKSLHRA